MSKIDVDMLRDPPKQYRPLPFWSWNDKLTLEETKWQIQEMAKAGIGGFFMHARGGLKTPYMGKEWFENIRVSIKEAQKYGMSAWGYDENGWPSGFGNGTVNGAGVDFQQKYLRCHELSGNEKNLIFVANYLGKKYALTYEVNPYYVDTLNREVSKRFIEQTHKVYARELGDFFSGFKGFFMDEPQISRNGIPWSFVLPQEYQNKYQTPLEPLLIELFFETGDYKNTRCKFWSLIRDLFADNFMRPIYEWCESNKKLLTGHMVLEERLHTQTASSGAVMAQYEYLHIPGMDWLGKRKCVSIIPRQVSSVAHQLGKKQVLSETFALSGWNVSFREMRKMFEQQMVRGVTLLCQHLEGYSLRGIRKRDYPPSLFFQQPWWSEYKKFNDLVSRIGMLLTEGHVKNDVLVLHPQSMAWKQFDGMHDYGEEVKEIDSLFIALCDQLDRKQIQYDLGDERIISRYASVEEGIFKVGYQEYRHVLVPEYYEVPENIQRMLIEFEKQGGEVHLGATDKLPHLLIEAIEGTLEEVASTVREFDDETMYYIVNSGAHKVRLKISMQGTQIFEMNPECGEIREIDVFSDDDYSTYYKEISPGSSCVFFAREAYLLNDVLQGDWEIVSVTPNALLLDNCEYRIDNCQKWGTDYVSELQEKFCAVEKELALELKFSFMSQVTRMALCIENPEKYQIDLNGCQIEPQSKGYYHDKAFELVDISKQVRCGENILILRTHFAQSEVVYENLKKAVCFESERNKLTYDQEVENVYLVGDFRVNQSREIEAPEKMIHTGNFSTQGYPFFSGKIRIKKNIFVTKQQAKRAVIKPKEHNAILTKVFVNGKPAGELCYEPYELKIGNFLYEGDNTVELELIGSLRNLLGPHHLKDETSKNIAPESFFRHSTIWQHRRNEDWTEDYNCVPFGIEF